MHYHQTQYQTHHQTIGICGACVNHIGESITSSIRDIRQIRGLIGWWILTVRLLYWLLVVSSGDFGSILAGVKNPRLR